MPAPNRIRCLLIDDDEGAFHHTQTLLGQIPWAGLELEWVDGFAEGEEAVARQTRRPGRRIPTGAR